MNNIQIKRREFQQWIGRINISVEFIGNNDIFISKIIDYLIRNLPDIFKFSSVLPTWQNK